MDDRRIKRPNRIVRKPRDYQHFGGGGGNLLMGPKEVKTVGAGVREEEQPLLEEPVKGFGRHTCRFFPFSTCQLLACVSPWLNRARSRY